MSSSVATFIALGLIILGLGGLAGSMLTRRYTDTGPACELRVRKAKTEINKLKSAHELEMAKKEGELDSCSILQRSGGELLEQWVERAFTCESGLLKLQVKEQLRVKDSR